MVRNRGVRKGPWSSMATIRGLGPRGREFKSPRPHLVSRQPNEIFKGSMGQQRLWGCGLASYDDIGSPTLGAPEALAVEAC